MMGFSVYYSVPIILLFLNTSCVLGLLMDSDDVFVFQLSEQCSAMMKELQSVQAELLKAAEQQRRAERERDDLIRESQRLEDTVCSLEREKEELTQVKEELRYNETESVFICLKKTLSQKKQQQHTNSSVFFYTSFFKLYEDFAC